MRADRLLSILILLKTRGRMTARELARELAVSERTIYRDIDVLSAARFPVYSEKGKQGGYALLPSDDLDLSGFNDRDLRALAALNIPEPFFELGLGSGLKTALAKLLSVLHDECLPMQNWQQNRFIISPPKTEINHKHRSGLQILQKAVTEDQTITCRMLYPIHFGMSEPIEMAPHTLIAFEGEWFLIAYRKDFYRVFPLKQLVKIQILERHFTRSESYDARSIWDHWQKTRREHIAYYTVTVLMEKNMLEYFSVRYSIPHKILDHQNATEPWKNVQIEFDSLDQARTIMLGLGGSVKVISPKELKLSIIDYAKLSLSQYGEG